MNKIELKNKIEMQDSLEDAFLKLSDGNAGAISVLSSLCENSPSIDKINAFGGFGHILLLDQLGIYGSKIWILYKDVCKQNILFLITVLRAYQLGFLSEKKIHNLILNYSDESLNLKYLLDKVKNSLGNENFG